jgi:hypothetical protein
MDEAAKVEFDIEVSVTDARDEDIDGMTRQLLSELRELKVESAELAQGGLAPQGSKGDPITIGSIALGVLPAAIPGVITLVQAWMTRGQGRTVKFKGKGIEFEGSPEELQKFLRTLEEGRKKK